LGKGKREWGGKGVGQYTANQGSERRGMRATIQRRDFQVSKGRVPRDKGGISKQQKGIIKRIGACTPMYISC
jgi:hypothetical protein